MTALSVVAAVILIVLTPSFAASAPVRACLSKDQERAAITDGRAVKLAAAIHTMRGRAGELISARLCHGAKGLEYVLTLLARDGKVTRATLDASSGTLIGRR